MFLKIKPYEGLKNSRESDIYFNDPLQSSAIKQLLDEVEHIMNYQKGHLAALTRSHLIGDHPSGLTKEQTTETMDPSPKTKGLRPYTYQ